MNKASDRVGWVTGLVIGLGAAIAVFTAGGAVSAPSAAAQEAKLTVTATPTGELTVSPTEVDLRVVSSEISGSFTVLNQTANVLDVRIKIDRTESELAGRLAAHITVSGQPVFDGALAELSTGSSTFGLASGETAVIEVLFTLADHECPYCTAVIGLQFVVEAPRV